MEMYADETTVGSWYYKPEPQETDEAPVEEDDEPALDYDDDEE